MNKIINSKFVFLGAIVLLTLGVFVAIPNSVSANGYNYGYVNPYGTPIINSYGYNRSSYIAPVSKPVYIQQPVYIPQPTPVYVQSNPVYIQTPTYIQQPTYYPVNYYSPISVSCSANNTNTYAQYGGYGGNVTWTAYASGGNGYYTYSWSGTDGLYGSGQSVSFNYSYSGVKYATVTVYSNGQSVTQACSNTVNVNNSYSYPTSYTYPVNYQSNYVPSYTVSNYNGLDIGCYVDPTNATINQPVTWTTEVTGGLAPYTYSWTGSDGLTGSQSSIIKYYDTAGSKSAIVTVTSADGKTGSHACSNTITIAKTAVAYHAPAPVKNQVVPVQYIEQPNQAASILSLSNVPWGWLAVIIILVLFFTVVYLIFNRQKI